VKEGKMDPQTADGVAEALAADTTARLVARPCQRLADEADQHARGLARLHAEATISGESSPDLDLMAKSLRSWARRLRG